MPRGRLLLNSLISSRLNSLHLLVKVADHVQGVENELKTFIIRRPYFDRARSSTLSENVKVEDLLSGVAKENTSFEVGEKREN